MKIRENFLSIAVPDISEEERKEAAEALDSGWISVGPKVKEFEKQFAEYHEVKHAIAMSSCTTALFIAAKVLGITKGDYVIVPTITWQSTANIVEQLDATPLFCDVEADELNINTEYIEDYIKEYGDKVKAIIPVHHSGLPADIDEITKISEMHNIPVIYDAAHAVFSSYKNKMIGQYGAMSAFSFYATKNITTGDGGMITTNDDNLAEQCRLWSYHGLPKDSWKRYSAENASPHVQSIVPGYKFNLTDIQAALGIAQLKRKEDLLSKRNFLVENYNKFFKNYDWLDTPVFETRHGKWGNHVYVIKILDEDIDRDKLMQELRKMNIGTNLHFYPVHKNLYYEKKYPDINLPVSEWLMDKILTLPLCTKYSVSDLEYVRDCLDYIYENRLANKTVYI
ncbi:MAG TPA: DegT/DnrJ/EryC1/StrS aminotransferase family protein [Ignavibacteria bacterium]|nr:UDP-4-amino-4,6-dideoxy-N-acetyl-beta-L-altrosamine transaminase [Bacteroidota bacterium]HRI84778.1 DegT/DnrJ/EryC1/StrS aminotransferase family protein [Ignavibacteria bacterium]HRJ98466.1 DegT/DnrJ/EryC1/StrS aminotransferase family protein [Ignavibacteria bacterium]